MAVGPVPGQEKLRGVLAGRNFTAGEAVIRVPSKLAVRLASQTAQVPAPSSFVRYTCWFKLRLRGRSPSLPKAMLLLLTYTGQSSTHVLYGRPEAALALLNTGLCKYDELCTGFEVFESAPHPVTRCAAGAGAGPAAQACSTAGVVGRARAALALAAGRRARLRQGELAPGAPGAAAGCGVGALCGAGACLQFFVSGSRRARQVSHRHHGVSTAHLKCMLAQQPM